MKNLIFLLAFITLAGPLPAASTPDTLGQFVAKDLVNYSKWFSSAKMSGSRTLELIATHDFNRANEIDQKTTMTEVLKAWVEREGEDAFNSRPVVTVLTPRGGSLWTLNDQTHQAELVQPWDMIQPPRAGSSPISGRLFTYEGLGFQSSFNGSGSFSGNFELGSFLYKDVLDGAINIQGTDMFSNTAGDSSSTSYLVQDWTLAFGLSSRIHFPLDPKIGLTGNIGGGLNLQLGGEASASPSSTPVPTTSTITADGLLGVSKALNPFTSLDLTVQLQTYPAVMLGLTTFLSPPPASAGLPLTPPPGAAVEPAPAVAVEVKKTTPPPTDTSTTVWTATLTPTDTPVFTQTFTDTVTATFTSTVPPSSEDEAPAQNAIPSLSPTPSATTAAVPAVATPNPAVSGGAVSPQSIGIVFLHGKNHLPAQFKGVASRLQAEGYQVALPRMAWSSGRTYDQSFSGSLKAVDEAVQSLQAQGATRILVGGIGQGAHMALAYAGGNPQVAGLVLIGPRVYPEEYRGGGSGHNHGMGIKKQIEASIDEARDMVKNGQGDQVSTFDDKEEDYVVTVKATANDYLSYMDPNGPGTMEKAVKGLTRSLPVLMIAESGQIHDAKSIIYNRLMPNKKSVYKSTEWREDELIANSVGDIDRWIRQLEQPK